LQIGEELRHGKVEASHLPGFRYLYQDEGQQVARASPRIKVSAMSHHARALAAAVRGSLGGSNGSSGNGGVVTTAGAPCSDTHPCGSNSGDLRVLQVLAKSSQDCWAAGWQPGDGRQLLAVRERRTEREPQEAAEVMQAFAATNFLT